MGRAGRIATRAMVVALCVAVIHAGQGCASRRGEVRHVTMEPVEFVAHRTDHGVTVEHLDAATLFREAGAAFEAGHHQDAVSKYRRLLTDFPGSAYRVAARYNLGLALEELGRFREAASQYEAIIHEVPGTQDARDSMYRLAHCLVELRDYDRATELLRRLLASPHLPRNDRLTTQVRLGEVLLAAGKLDEAERAFRKVVSRRRLQGRPAPLLADDLVAEAQFGLARVEHERFRRLPIRLPQDVMEKDIEAKARAFLRAQAAYLRTIRLRVVGLVTAAGLQIGRLYEEFYRDLMEAPVPDDLTPEEVEVYFEELRKVIRPLVDQAIHVYERNLVYARKLGADNEWVHETQARLARLEKFLEGDQSKEPGLLDLPETDPRSPEFVGPPPPSRADQATRAPHADQTPSRHSGG